LAHISFNLAYAGSVESQFMHNLNVTRNKPCSTISQSDSRERTSTF